MAKKVALVSCVKSKREVPSPACDLYASQLFQGMRRYAEQNADAWFILSAEHGVLSPDEVIAPYEKTLNKMGKAARSQWSARVVQQLSETRGGDCCDYSCWKALSRWDHPGSDKGGIRG